MALGSMLVVEIRFAIGPPSVARSRWIRSGRRTSAIDA
jgi:hypothetical protein